MSITEIVTERKHHLKLYSTHSQQKEAFKSFDPSGKLARIYVCGVTPYDTSHMGHAMTALTFDVLHRYLEHLSFTVKHVQNITDIDDDILKRAKRDGADWQELGQKWNQIYLDSLATLNCLPFDAYIPATAKIPEIITLVGQLLEKGYAYHAKDGNIYFEAAKFPAYGKMSHLSEQEMLEKAHAAAADSFVDDPANAAKKDVRDFIVWQAHTPGEPKWSAPWGEGRPGWHIECSAISLSEFGTQFEVHGGGADLIFPHHSSEIAQSEAVTHVHPFVGYWMHVGMVYLGAKKMSKSLGNLVLVRDAVKTNSPDAIRLYLLKCHYRTPLHYEDSGVKAAELDVKQLKKALANEEVIKFGTTLEPTPWEDRFYAALDDDLDTPEAVAVALELANLILNNSDDEDMSAARASLKGMLSILGMPFVDSAIVSGQGAGIENPANLDLGEKIEEEGEVAA
jgi:L-cysteine:1D-myo-inositol 2-amino-2-deoxy-alpha-D-glucopyranoside ligase